MLRSSDKALQVGELLSNVWGGVRGWPVAQQIMVYVWNVGTGVAAPITNFTATAGAWSTFGDASQTTGGYVHNTSAAVNDTITLPSVFLTTGTWKCTILALTSNVRGISTLLLNGDANGTADWYSASLVYSVSKDITGIVVSKDGLYTVAFKMLTKNASSSAYWFDPSYIRFERTA